MPVLHEQAHLCRWGLRGGQLRQVGGHVGAHVQRQHGLLLQVLLQRCAMPLRQTTSLHHSEQALTGLS